MIRLGVIGLGARAAGVVALLRRIDPEVSLSAVADVDDAARVRERCTRAAIPDAATRLFSSVTQMLADVSELDGIVIGTRCNLHTEMAVACAKTGLPLLLEKPVATDPTQLAALAQAFNGRGERVVVSFPLRFSPMFRSVLEVVRSGRLGVINQIQAFNYVPYGGVYFGQWYRSFETTGGMWLQKATHDFDYITQLLDSTPVKVAAFGTRRIYGGDRPPDLKCSECDRTDACPESPRAIAQRNDDGGMGRGDHWCAFSNSIQHHDAGSAIVCYQNGVHAAYSQNFVARRGAGARGARITGYLGTLEFDWMKQAYTIFEHHSGKNETIPVTVPEGHFGGDTYLARNFLDVIRGTDASRAPLSTGLLSAALCMAAQRSDESGVFEPV